MKGWGRGRFGLRRDREGWYAALVIEVVCAVIVRGDSVLLCRRQEGVHLAGHWEFPGGKVEGTETRREALAREIREELACEVEIAEALGGVEHQYPEVKSLLHPFLCTIPHGEPQAIEHEEIGWFGADEVRALGLAGADQEVWRRFACQQ